MMSTEYRGDESECIIICISSSSIITICSIITTTIITTIIMCISLSIYIYIYICIHIHTYIHVLTLLGKLLQVVRVDVRQLAEVNLRTTIHASLYYSKSITNSNSNSNTNTNDTLHALHILHARVCRSRDVKMQNRHRVCTALLRMPLLTLDQCCHSFTP